MKSVFFAAVSLCLLMACGNSKKITSGSETQKLQGAWQLNYITGPRIAFEGLFPDDRPTITFDISDKKISGNTSCNSYSGSFSIEGSKISFGESMAVTKKSCLGEGESVFLRTLKKINGYDVTAGYTLSLLTDGIASMRFTKVR